MNKRVTMLSVVLLVLIALSNFSYAIEVSDVGAGINPIGDSARINAEINSKFASIEARLSELPTKQENTDLLTAHLITTNQLLDQFKSFLIVGFVVSGILLIGLAFGVLFYFKSKGRL